MSQCECASKYEWTTEQLTLAHHPMCKAMSVPITETTTVGCEAHEYELSNRVEERPVEGRGVIEIRAPHHHGSCSTILFNGQDISRFVSSAECVVRCNDVVRVRLELIVHEVKLIANDAEIEGLAKIIKEKPKSSDVHLQIDDSQLSERILKSLDGLSREIRSR